MSLGDGLVVASVVTFSIGGVLIQRLARETDALYASAMIYACGTLMLALHTLAVGAAPNVGAWLPGLAPDLWANSSAEATYWFGVRRCPAAPLSSKFPGFCIRNSP